MWLSRCHFVILSFCHFQILNENASIWVYIIKYIFYYIYSYRKFFTFSEIENDKMTNDNLTTLGDWTSMPQVEFIQLIISILQLRISTTTRAPCKSKQGKKSHQRIPNLLNPNPQRRLTAPPRMIFPCFFTHFYYEDWRKNITE